MNRESPGRTGNDRRGTGNNRDGTWNKRDGTVAPSGPIQTPAEIRQIYGNAPVNAVRVPVLLRYIRKQALCRNATGIHRGSAGAFPATTGVKQGVAVTLSGSDAGIDTVSAGSVTVYWGSAGFHRGSTGALPATNGAMSGRCRFLPGHFRRQSGL
ncbi:hypothetical protein DPMN_135854 [Dreissena polymorpha]|uniref:Uncharacterized protein n=1 Tax=Dreissena polymorpha TaxID=45954 RepID=A0A9D4G2Q6_DREPO|nr:hypothetical protein DPMN_135854 [Dreissena polymorpha]